MDKLTIFSKGLLSRLSNDKLTMDQANLYLDFVQKELSLDNYFIRQSELEKLLLQNSAVIDWDELKNKNLKEYNHEKAHSNVWKKYGVRSRLYRWNHKGEPFVIDVDFKHVSKKKNYDKEMVINILKEMLLAPYRVVGDTLFACAIDILFFEILDKKITLFNLELFEKAFSKYFTSTTR